MGLPFISVIRRIMSVPLMIPSRFISGLGYGGLLPLRESKT